MTAPPGIALFETQGHTYAVVTAPADHGVQMMRLTYLDTIRENPFGFAAINDTASLLLDGADGIAIFEASDGTDTNTYAAVVARESDNGVQILKLTDGDVPLADPVGAGNINDTDSLLLNSDEVTTTGGIAIFEASDGTNTNTYAAVTGYEDDGVQILRLTSGTALLSNPVGAGKIADTEGTNELLLDGPWHIATFEASDGTNTNTYAAVTGYRDHGVQILRLTSGTALLSNPVGAGKIADTDSLLLANTPGIAIFEASNGTNTNTYAVATAFFESGVQILQLTDGDTIRSNPAGAGQIADTDSLLLDGAYYIATFEVSNGTNTDTYAAVTTWYTDLGVQILKLTDGGTILSSPAGAGQIADTDSLELNGASGIATFEASDTNSNTNKYAAVTAFIDDGVQILKMALPNSPPVLAAAPTITVGGSVTTSAYVFEGAAVSIRWPATDADGEAIDYAWSHDMTDLIPQFTSTTDTVEFTVPELSEDATLTVTLTATDHHGAADSDTLSLELVILVADAGNDRTVAPGAAVTLDGSGSTGIDGTTYEWTQTSGTPTVPITNGDSTAPSFTAPDATSPVDLVFTLEVARAGSVTVTDTVTVSVDPRRLCHDVEDAGKRYSADPAGHRNRHDHRLGRPQPQRYGHLKPPGPRVR